MTHLLRMPEDRHTWAEAMLTLCRFGLGFYLLLLPFGTTFREIGGITATVAVAAYYALDWRGSVLRRHPLRWIFAAFLGLILFKTVHTVHPSLSWYILRQNMHSTLFMGIAGLESLREWRHIRTMFWCVALMACAEGLVGVWQGVTGSTPGEGQQYVDYGRLVGTMGTPRVGNLLSLALPLSLLTPIASLSSRKGWEKVGLAVALAAPTMYLLACSKTRSGWFGFCTAAMAILWLRYGWKALWAFLAACAAVVVLASPQNITWESLTTDNRWEIWSAAVRVFLAHPLLGAGINTFGDAYVQLGITLSIGPMPHPHNIYLQFLAETGLVGFAALLAVLFGTLACMALPLWRRRAMPADPRFLMTLAPTAAWAGYMVTAISAHDFFRTWWLGYALAVQGLGLAAARLLDEDRPA